MKTIYLVVLAFFISGCSSLSETTYTQPDHGVRIIITNQSITGSLDDGTQLTGKYADLNNKTAAFNALFNEVQKASKYSWTHAQGITLNSTEKDGLVLSCLAAVVNVPSLGHGRCIDNKGKIYRLRF